ncbi:hypothetical protein M514_16155 [Trichuris suis]|uniref:Uncharacterized protein n=1 Tax=Trichuris suis TaxID=68888 RepID=A0A085NQ89_9BILA|nr:hypothetical protein M514_16155 [Trichuris suis]
MQTPRFASRGFEGVSYRRSSRDALCSPVTLRNNIKRTAARLFHPLWEYNVENNFLVLRVCSGIKCPFRHLFLTSFGFVGCQQKMTDFGRLLFDKW